jgi:hypothetical protein
MDAHGDDAHADALHIFTFGVDMWTVGISTDVRPWWVGHRDGITSFTSEQVGLRDIHN